MSKKSRAEINKSLDYLDEIVEILKTADEYSAVRVLRTLIKRNEYLENYAKQVVEATNTSHMGNALMKIQAIQVTTKGEILPPEMLDIPELWFIGTTRIPRMSLFQAKKKYRHLKPHLEDAWLALEKEEEKETLREEMIEKYKTTMPDEMATICYIYIKKYEVELAEEEGSTGFVDDTNMGEMNSILDLFKVDYGVGGG